ncbi:MAG: patatin-like phospholipase family protein [Rhodospirillaceae bacterium]|nr:patatin-like phospholipase family protein [Rhodospirillaceae bacterium]
MARGAGAAVWACIALALAGCGGEIVHGNPPLGPGGARSAPAYDYETLSRRTDTARNSDEILVIVALSGGGTRAAALGFGVLEALQAATIRVPGTPLPGVGARRPVLQEVDVISANSGGSFLAAYYAIHRARMFERDAAGRTAFERAMLKRDVTRDLLRGALGNVVRINTTGVNRSDVAAEIYGHSIFADRSYGDLVPLGRPYLVVNAQDTTKGARFEFTQAQFDLICSDLSGVPLARAVTASSAVHGVFAPIKLRNYPRARCPPEPRWIAAALRGEGDPKSLFDDPRSRLVRARTARWYRDKLPDAMAPPQGAEFFVHLADGGAADNLGLRAPLFMLASRDSETGLRARIESGRVKAVLLIAVNAADAPDPLRDTDAAGPTISRMIQDAVDGLIRTVTDDSLRDASYVLQTLRAEARRRGQRTGFYGPVIVDFEALPNAAERTCFKRIETSLDLPEEQVDALREAGRRLLAASPEFRRFLAAHAGEPGTLPALPAAAKFCPGRGRQAARGPAK